MSRVSVRSVYVSSMRRQEGGGGGEAYGIYRKSRLCTSCSVVSAVERVGVRRDVVLAKGAQK